MTGAQSVDTTGESSLPLLTHEYVLGVDIHVSHRETETHDYVRRREDAVEVEAYDGERRQQPCRQYLAAWARRSLFSGGESA